MLVVSIEAVILQHTFTIRIMPQLQTLLVFSATLELLQVDRQTNKRIWRSLQSPCCNFSLRMCTYRHETHQRQSLPQQKNYSKLCSRN